MLAVIPARGGSRGIPHKNVREFLGRPLLAWAVDVARESGVCEPVVVSTEDEEIAAIARRAGADIVERPAELARDETPTAPVVRHALDELDGSSELVVVLEPTAPARRAEHVRGTAELLRDTGADSVATVSEIPHHYVPEKALRLAADGTIAGLDGTPLGAMTHRRQDLSVSYALNGIVFGCRTELLRRDPPTLWGERVVAHVIDPRFAVDLDRPEDWEPAEAQVRKLLEDA